MRFAIIGAGLAGLSCAEGLTAAGHTAELFDKARGPGGRMSTRRLETRFGTAHIDHGATCFHAVEPAFRKVVAGWQSAGLVQPWPAGGKDAWVGVPRMSAVIGHMAAPHQVAWGTLIYGVLKGADGAWYLSSDKGRHGPFDAVVVAVPAEQAVPILALYDLEMARMASMASSKPCWAGLFVFEESLPLLEHDVGAHAVLSRAVCNRTKPDRDGPEAWLVQANADWSKTHLEAPRADVSAELLSALAKHLNLQSLPAVEATAHLWRYAAAEGIGRSVLWNASLKLGACGDWLLGPRAESAWLSGRSLARTVGESCPAESAA